ncbi:MAG: hypothetical protein J6T81_00070 [Bacteroidales bacterium]|nr:hypothetical protein [Bacteroidales bacterium]
MDLKEFTKETLVQIVHGVEEANNELSEKHAHVTSHAMKNSAGGVLLDDRYTNAIEVEFDVAVTATETDGTKGGGGIRVAQILFGGIEASNSTENQSISRVKFSIPLVLEK